MATDNPRSTAQIAGHPIHPMVIAFPIACFVLAFASDVMSFVRNGSGQSTFAQEQAKKLRLIYKAGRLDGTSLKSLLGRMISISKPSSVRART